VRSDADRLVDHDDVVVLVEHDEPVHQHRVDLDRRVRRRQRDLQPGPRRQAVRLAGRAAVQQHVTRLGQFGDDRAGQAEQAGQTGIHPHAVQAVGHRQRA
jgi:hypothetical protein